MDLRRTHSRNRHGADYLQLVRLSDPLRHVKSAGGRQADVEEVITHLDRLDVPHAYGRAKARDLLADAGIRRGNDLLAEALRERKRRFDLSRTGADDEPGQDPLPDADEPQDSQ